MATKKKNLSEHDSSDILSVESNSFGIVCSDWNEEITSALRDAAISTLEEYGAKKDNIHTVQVPGSFELPIGAKMLMQKHNPDAVICIGCVIKGETKHDEYISNSVAGGIMNLNIISGIPVIFGVLTPNNMEQALDRAGGKHGNKGVEAAITAIKMVNLSKELKNSGKKIGF